MNNLWEERKRPFSANFGQFHTAVITNTETKPRTAENVIAKLIVERKNKKRNILSKQETLEEFIAVT